MKNIKKILTNFFNKNNILHHATKFKTLNLQMKNLSRAVEQTDESILITNSQGSIEFVNKAFVQMTGYKKEEAIGKTPSLVKSGKSSNQFYSLLWKTILSGKSFEAELENKKKNGELFWVNQIISPIKDESGQISHFVSNIRDITQKKKLEFDTKMMAMFAELNPSPVLRFDKEGNITTANKAVFQLISQIVVGKKIFNVFSCITKEVIKNAIEKNEVIIVSQKIRKRYYQFTVCGSAGVSMAQAYGSDITEKVHAKELAEESSRSKSQFLATMSHEIRTPMNSVLGMTEMLTTTELTKKQEDYIESIKTSGDILLSTINNILDFSKIESGKLQLEEVATNIFSLFRNLQKIMEQKAQQKELILEQNIEATLPTYLKTDKVRLQQVLINLVNNAIKFTHEGTIEISAKVLEQKDDQYILQFMVKDTGIGIADDKLDRLFHAFSQAESSTHRKYGGTGLGLAISAKIVKAMGGKIWVESQKGRGSSFFFTIKTSRASQNEIEPINEVHHLYSKPRKSNTTLKILIAEDNSLNQKLIFAMLENLGYKADLAINGVEVLSLLERKEYDIIFMDIEMPELDGIETTKQIRSKYSETTKPIIVAVTANAMLEEKMKCLNAGMDGYLTKPINLKVIDETLLRLQKLS